MQAIEKLAGSDWKLVVNNGDVMQGTGSSTALALKFKKKGVSMAVQDILASAISTIHLQLRSRYYLGTYKSSYGILMMMLHGETDTTFCSNRQVFVPFDQHTELKPMFCSKSKTNPYPDFFSKKNATGQLQRMIDKVQNSKEPYIYFERALPIDTEMKFVNFSKWQPKFRSEFVN